MSGNYSRLAASRVVGRLAIGGLLLAIAALGALAVWANMVAQGHTRDLSRVGVQTSGHLGAAQALAQIDKYSDILEDGIDPLVLRDLRAAQVVLDDSLQRMQRERREESAAASVASARIDRAATALIPLALLLVGLCAWLLTTARSRADAERERMETDLRLAQRLEAVGHLAAGIAHEINTPIQFVGDSVRFIGEAYEDLRTLSEEYKAIGAELAGGREDEPAIHGRVRAAEDRADLDYLDERVPAAFARTLAGVARVTSIVAAMRSFGQPPQNELAQADLNEGLRSTLVVAQSEYKYVADIETEFGELPPVLCNASELNQVFLNLIVNAAHAIGEAVPSGSTERGAIWIKTGRENGSAIVTISDSGPGIPPEIRERIFDPFFTTKEVGKGTGQGLAIASSIVNRHGGTLTLESGRVTTFAIRLPIG